MDARWIGAIGALALIAGACSGCPGERATIEPEAAPPDAAPGESHLQLGAHELSPDKGDWDAIVRRGAIRVLVASTEEAFLPRRGMPGALDRRLIRELARRHDLEVQFILVPEHDRLLPLLAEGIGDVVAAQLTVTEARAEDVAFTWPLRTVEEILVGRRGGEGAPRSAAELAGRQVHVRGDSAYAETLREVAGGEAPGLEIVAVPEHVDTETLAYEVAQGERPLTVVDSHLLEAIETYNEDLERLVTLREGREIAWALRPENPALKAVIDAFLVEAALTGRADPIFTGDLDGIHERGTLRVLTRNNPVTYFLHRGERRGFEYKLAELLAEALGVRLEMIVAPSRDELIPWLLEGRGDVIAASLTVTPARAEQVAFSLPYLQVDEVVVGPARRDAGAGEIRALADLEGHTLHVRRSSSYFETLEALRVELGLSIETVPEDLETMEILAMVAEGELPLTVADSHVLQVERAYRDDLAPLLSLTAARDPAEALPTRVGLEGGKAIAFAVRPDALELAAAVDAFVESLADREAYHAALARYFDSRRSPAARRLHRPSGDGRISSYDPLIQRYAAKHGLDWRLMAALAWRESRFDASATSWVGALGLFQVMPRTGRALGFTNLHDPAQSTHAGIMYFHQLLSRLDPRIPFDERLLFALAGYNTGIGHVGDARRLAARQGLDPNRWFDNVEQAMLLLAKPQYHRQARHGYVRGHEPVTHVREIYEQYETYVQLAPP
jgi:membrane-bound lytic murein transglycosylase F